MDNMHSLMVQKFLFENLEDDYIYEERDLTDEEYDNWYEDELELEF